MTLSPTPTIEEREQEIRASIAKETKAHPGLCSMHFFMHALWLDRPDVIKRFNLNLPASDRDIQRLAAQMFEFDQQ